MLFFMPNVSSMYKVHSKTSTNLHPILYYFTNHLCYLCYFYRSKCYFSDENHNIDSVFCWFFNNFYGCRFVLVLELTLYILLKS